jgi:hypothetical protein
VTGANCFHVRGDSGVNETYITNRHNDSAVQNMNGEGLEVIRYDSSQDKPVPKS